MSEGSLEGKLASARRMAWKRFGREITFYVPGMFSLDGVTGCYPAVSITGGRCELRCDHCAGRILGSMPRATTPEALYETCLAFSKKSHGLLLTGGSDREGRLPWKEFLPVIRRVKDETGLFISAHCGLLDNQTAAAMKDAGVDQALVDVIGNDETFQSICHVPFGVSRIADTMASLQNAGLPLVPHIVCGIDYGRIKGEREALRMISCFEIEQLVIVSLMAIPKTPVWGVKPPAPEVVAEIIAEARFLMPNTRISLGCARTRGSSILECLAIDAGVNRLALPSEEAIERARSYGLDIRYQRTCCSVSKDISGSQW